MIYLYIYPSSFSFIFFFPTSIHLSVLYSFTYEQTYSVNNVSRSKMPNLLFNMIQVLIVSYTKINKQINFFFSSGWGRGVVCSELIKLFFLLCFR